MKKNIFLFFIACIFISSCRKKIEFPQWEVNALFPIAQTSLKITELVKDTILKTNSDQSLSIVFSGEAYKINFDSLFRIPDTTILQSFKFPFNLPFPVYPGSTLYNDTQSTKYNLQNVELTEVIVKSGVIDVKLHSTFRGKTVLTYQLPLATINGNSLFISDTLPAAAPGNSSVISKSYDISGYKIDLKGMKGNSFNTVVSNFRAIAADTTMIYANDSVTVVNTFKNVIPEFAKGYFGKAVVNSESVNTAVKKLPNIIGGNFDLKNFNLTLTVQNRVGVDIRFLLSEIVSENISSGANIPLVNSIVGNALNINRASVISSVNYPPIAHTEYVINFNETNSNAADLIEIFPDSISASSQITFNPLGNISNSNDFIYYGNGIDVSLDVEIPLFFSAQNLILADTLPISFKPDSADSATKKITGGNLILNCYNSYPFSAKPQLFLMNENFAIFETLVADGGMIDAADLDANFKSAGKKFSRIFIPLNQDRIEKLKAAKNLYVKLFFSTASLSGHVKIYSDYSVELKLVADINYTMSEL